MKKTNPQISVIIPFFNHADFLEEAVESVCVQTYSDFEILIVDDCSTEPEAKTILKKLKSKGIRLFRTHKNSGPAAARNLGAKHARGEFFCFLDADDRFDCTFLEKAWMSLKKNSNIDFVYSFIQHFDQDDSLHETLCPYNFFSLLFHNQLPYAALIRATAFRDVKGYRAKLNKNESEDWDFWIRMGKKNHFGWCIPEPLFYYRKSRNLRLKNVQSHYDQIVKKLRRRHDQLYRPMNLFWLWWRWKHVKKRKQSWQHTRSKVFHLSPQWLRKIILKFHEAELLETKHWKSNPWTCFLLMIPIFWRKEINTYFSKRIFPEQIRFSDIHFSRKNSSIGDFLIPHGHSCSKTKKTILLFFPWIPMGGVETVMLHLLRKLHLKFHFVVLTTQKNENSLHTLFARFATVYHLPNLFDTKKEKIQYILQKIESLNIEKIFIVNSLFAFKLIPFFKEKFPNISIATSLHGWDQLFDFLSVSALYFPFLDSVICVSDSVRTKFENVLGETSNRIQVIKNTLDFDLLDTGKKSSSLIPVLQKETPHQRNVVFLGRYNSDKNPHFFIDIANFFLTDLELTHVRFFLFGEGVEQPSLSRRAKEINTRAGTSLISVEKKQINIAAIYKEADVLVNCSPREGFGMSALEAMYFGVRVVGFDLDVFSEILPQKYFFSVPQRTKYRIPLFAKQIFAATQTPISSLEKKKLATWVRKNFSEKSFLSGYQSVFEKNIDKYII